MVGKPLITSYHKGVEHRTIADLMGHQSITTFERIYGHRLNPVVTEAAEPMDNIWGDGDEDAAWPAQHEGPRS